MAEPTLFELPEPQESQPAIPARPEDARLLRANRSQVEWAPRDLDSLIPPEHTARAIWAMLERLDLSAFYVSIKAVLGRPGHPTTDPQVLLALWLYATAEGVGSARQLARLCQEHDAYRWLRGGLSTNYHTLSAFRVANQAALDELLTQILAAMLAEGLVTLRHVAQDGMRTRAGAGAVSFRRQDTLERCLLAAQQQVARLAEQREHPDPGVSRREQAARERAARDREGRVAEALRRLPAIEAVKAEQTRVLPKAKRSKVREPRVSTTDAEATVMKMADGGFRPAYNLEVASDVDSQVIVAVGVVSKGSDGGQALPVVAQLQERSGQAPEAYLIDGGYVSRGDITALARQGIIVYAPTRPPRTATSGRTQAQPRPDDTPEVGAWRARMETAAAKEVYKERAATAECVNAHLRRYGLRQLLVRGTGKVLSVLLLVAISHDLLRWIALGA